MLLPRGRAAIYPRSGASKQEDELEWITHNRGTQVVSWSYAAAVTFLIYDILLTMEDEVHLIWPIPCSLTKFVFFLIRYFPVVLEMSTQFYGTPPLTYSPRGCYAWNVYQGLASIIVVMAVDYILLLRVYAMYPRSKAVKYISAILYVGELVTMSTGIALAVPKLVFDERCVVHESPTIFIVAAACPIVYQTFLFGVTLYKFVCALRAGWGNVPFVQLIVRDGTWAFMLLFIVLISEAALYGFAAKAYTGFLYGWLNTAFSVCGYRILINLHDLDHKMNGRGNNNITAASTGVQFTSFYQTTAHTGTTGFEDADGTFASGSGSYEMSPIRTTVSVVQVGQQGLPHEPRGTGRAEETRRWRLWARRT